MKAKGQYEKALYDSGVSTKLEYIDYSDSRKNKDQRQRKRNIIWFNPPYLKNVKTNIGKIFFKLLHKHFPKSNKLYKIFNRNRVKIRYSCMKNLNSIISSHNALQLKTNNDNNSLCNCRNQESCPLQGKCLTRNVSYQATVTSKGDIKTYIELLEIPLKERYRNHIKDFNNSKYRNSTEVTKHIWQLKENNKDFEMDWKIVKRTNSVQNSGRCNLWLYEKLFIITSIDDRRLLNKRSELISKCRHKNKVLVGSLKQ